MADSRAALKTREGIDLAADALRDLNKLCATLILDAQDAIRCVQEQARAESPFKFGPWSRTLASALTFVEQRRRDERLAALNFVDQFRRECRFLRRQIRRLRPAIVQALDAFARIRPSPLSLPMLPGESGARAIWIVATELEGRIREAIARQRLARRRKYLFPWYDLIAALDAQFTQVTLQSFHQLASELRWERVQLAAPRGQVGSTRPTDGMKSARDWAPDFNIEPESFRKRLDRARLEHRLTDEDWLEATDRRPGKPRFLYSRAAAELAAKAAPRRGARSGKSAKASSLDRPTGRPLSR